MKRIVRLTETDLTRIVKRVIKEEANALADKILSEMEYLCNNGDAESDAMVAAVLKIKDKATYDAIHDKVRKGPNFKQRQGKNYGQIVDWLEAEGLDSYMEGKASPFKAIANIGASRAQKITDWLQQYNQFESASYPGLSKKYY